MTLAHRGLSSKKQRKRARSSRSPSLPTPVATEPTVSATKGTSRRQYYLFLGVLAAFILTAMVLHYQSFDGPMLYDSNAHVQSKEHVYASGHLLNVIGLFPQRPVAMISFYLNYLMWGMNPFFFRLVNAIILALTAFMATACFILILELTGAGAGPEKKRQIQALGIFLGLIYLVHPVQTYFVAYIWQRMGLLCCLFYISALAVYVAVRAGRIRHVVAGYSLCLVLFLLALASKEKAITFPLVLVLAEIAFFWNGWRNLLKRIAIFALIVLPLLVIFSFLVHPHGHVEQSPGLLATVDKYYRESNLSLWQVLISQCRVLFSYLALLAAPTPSNARFTTAHFIFNSPLESPEIAAAVLGALAILTAGIVLLRKRPLTGFGLLFFLVNLMPESFLVPQYLFFAYRANLPLFGLLLIVGDILLEVRSRAGALSRPRLRLATAISVLLAAIVVGWLGAVTVSKSKLWGDPVAFWDDLLEGLPPSGSNNLEKRVRIDVLDNLGVALHRQARQSDAVELFQKALQIDSLFIPSYVHLAVSYSALGDKEKAESSLKKAIEIHPDAIDAQFALAEFYINQHRLASAWHHMQKATALTPSAPRCLNGLGKILLREGKPSEAAPYFRKAIETAPGLAEAYYNLGEAYVGMGMAGDAERQFRKALMLKKEDWKAHNSLGLLLAQAGKTTEAAEHFNVALALSPRDWRIYNNLGAMFAKSGDYQNAATQFEKAHEINPEDILTQKNLERVRSLMGNPSAR